MQTAPVLYLSTREEWRQWLEENFQKEQEAWLVYPKKSSGKSRILYNDAVEEALCFGWIDSIVKTLDKDHLKQKFTPRHPKSTFSQPNRERLRWLITANKIHPSVRNNAEAIISEVFHFPDDILEAIRTDSNAWEHYQKFTEAYQRIRIAYIDSARHRPEEFTKRLSHFIEKTRNNKLIKGFGGIEKYY